MKHRAFSILIVLAICAQALIPSAAAANRSTQTATQQEITDAILSLQEEYPEGMVWTNQSPSPAYRWVFPGSLWSMGGCAAFAAIIQDAAIGSYKDIPPSWQRVNDNCRSGGVYECAVPYSWDNLWPGDIIRFDGHSVIIVEKHDDYVTIAEGNYGGKVKWGREITRTGVEKSAQYVLTRYSKTEPLMPYTDLPARGHWSYNPIVWALVNDIAAPISATKFEPKSSCSRADMVFFLWAASDCPEPELQDLPFTDVPASAPYYKAVLWALQQHVVAGTSATTFSPNALCSRAEAMTILWRAVGSPAAESDGNHFYDVPCGKYYYRSVTWAAANQITSGTSNTTFSPHRTITRAEALTFLYIIKRPQA